MMDLWVSLGAAERRRMRGGDVRVRKRIVVVTEYRRGQRLQQIHRYFKLEWCSMRKWDKTDSRNSMQGVE